jgi:hypothetical protein
MKSRGGPVYRLVTALVVAGFLGVLGCSDNSGLPPRYPVSGMVTYKGQPLEKGTINFLPDDAAQGRGATGEISNGKYRLSTTETQGDGALPGSYKVTINALDADLSKADEDTKKLAQKANVQAGGMPDQVAVAKVFKEAKNAVPAKYAQIATSGLAAEVKPEPNTFNFDLAD